MNLPTAVNFLQAAVPKERAVWADIGAGTGIFTLALDQLLEKGSTIYAADKNPHLLYSLQLDRSQLIVEELDFTRSFQLPLLDGVIMANALHYAEDHLAVLEKVLQPLKPGGVFILIEYELNRPRPPWIPFPIPFAEFEMLATRTDLSPARKLNEVASAYGQDHIYLAVAKKIILNH